jgi:anti-sigma factor RsiW
MHAVVIESLEEYLAGALDPVTRGRIEVHLNGCGECREELRGMQEVARLFGSLRSEESLSPSPAFCARVMQQVGQETSPSLASLFSLDFAFGRKVVMASLLTLAVLGSYLLSRETDYALDPTPEAVMAQDTYLPGQDRDRMLVTLTSYEP